MTTSTKKEWVVGFLFDPAANRVVLIRKNRPEWQAGRLNGVGGKVEPGEQWIEAMRREFEEEAGLDTSGVSPGWQLFASLTWEEGVVHFFRMFAPQHLFDATYTRTDEVVSRYRVSDLLVPSLLDPSPLRDSLTPNLSWLIPLAAHRHDDYDVISVVETGTSLRSGVSL